jgi:transposase
MKGRVKSMTEIRNIIHRLRMGQTNRQIHRDLRVHRSTVKELKDLAVTHQWLNTELPMPSDEEIVKLWNQKKIHARSHPLDAYKEQLATWHQEGLTSVVIQQLLKDRCASDIQVIRRYRHKHFPKAIEPIMVRSTVPGRDMEVDFGELGRFLDDDLTEKRVWLFSLRLRHSRKVYREIVLDQTLHTFLMGHVAAFEYFNGVPKNCIMDNLKAAVVRSTIDNDMINRSYQELAEHYGFLISPCLPRTPQHKGGVEGDVKYTKRNFLPYFLAKQKEIGIATPKICDLQEAMKKWDKDVADIHIVYGVGKSPLELFKSEEEQALQPLPKKRWEPTSWVQCRVRREWRIMVNNAYYSVPFQLIGETVEVCITHSLVRIFYRHQEIALHEKTTKKWDYRRKSEHAPPFQESVLQCSRDGLLELASNIGTFTHQVAYNILSHPSVDRLKPVRYMLKLAEKYSQERLEAACRRASNFKMYSYRSIKNILENNLESQPLEAPVPEKIIPLPRPRFARDPTDYKSTYLTEETFEEKLQRFHPISKHGNGMIGVFDGLLADQIIEDEKQYRRQESDQI